MKVNKTTLRSKRHSDAVASGSTDDRTLARATALGLLARREHAQAEIKRKLLQRGYDTELTTTVIDELNRERLLCDERFAECFIRSHADRGQGMVRIRTALQQLQLPAELIAQYLATADIDWAALAGAVRQRKFGATLPTTFAARAKQTRFLLYRGFTHEQIRAALGHACAALDSTDLSDEFI